MGVLVAVFLTIGSASAGTVAYRQMTELTHDAGLEHARAVLDALAIPAAVAIATHDYTKLDNFVAELERARARDILLMVVVDREGRLLATSGTGMVGKEITSFDAAFTEAALRSRDVWFQFGPDPLDPAYVDVSKPIKQGQRWGTLMARFSLERFSMRLDMLAESAIALTVVAAILGWMLAIFVLSRMVLGPTRELAEMATRIGEGQLGARSLLGDRHDEIGELSQALNVMASKLRVYTSELESAVRERTSELESANRELEKLATTDGLTGLKNFRFFRATLDFELRRGQRRPHELSLCMVDIDHFKQFNDAFGHPAGDEVLKRVASLLQDNLRSTDVVARYGGEEFAIILLDTAGDDAFVTAQKLAEVVRREPFEGAEQQPGGKLTISIGVAAHPDDAGDPNSLIRHADLALYEAKRRGRDRVVRYTVDLPQHTGVTSDVTASEPPKDNA
jgi:diguanylate cyclase (GGDEF)-like protein